MNQKFKQSIYINNDSLADIYFQLAHLHDSGLPAQESFKLLKLKKGIEKPFHQLLRLLEMGASIAESGFRAGIFCSFDKELIAAGEISGDLRNIYRQLAAFYGDKARRCRKLKSKLYFPFFILILALIIQPFPAFVLGEITGGEYLLTIIAQVLQIVLFLYSVFKMPYWLTDGVLRFLSVGHWVYRLQLTLPVISTWLIERQINLFFQCLGLMLDAGVSILDALPIAINTIKNLLLRKQFFSLIPATASGQNLTESLSGISEIDHQTIHLLLAGEKSGKLAETMLHFTKIETETHTTQEDLLVEWIPRLFYFVVAVWVATSIVAGNVFESVNIL